jgi:hypothetical protein
MTDKRVSEMTDAEIQQRAGARPPATTYTIEDAERRNALATIRSLDLPPGVIRMLAGYVDATFAVVDIATGWLDTSELEEHLAVIPMTDAAKTIIDAVDARLAKLLIVRPPAP